MTQHVADAKAWFERTESELQKGFYNQYPLNEFWKKHNTPKMYDILNNAQNDREALEQIQATYFFVVKLVGDAAEHAVRWQWNRLQQEDPALLSDIRRIGESPVVPDSLTLPYEGSRYSVDIFRVATVAKHVFHYAKLDKNGAPVFFELGAGLGHLARFILNLAPRAKYVISDLPISLCFSYLFLKHNFPDKRIKLMEADELLKESVLEQYDIILAPPSVLQHTRSIHVDMFINTCSLGEMDNSVSSQWFSYVEKVLQPTYLYSLNRFLNHIDMSADFGWRTQENAHLSGVSAHWDVVHFELENEDFFSPYLACIHPRYLELVLRRQATEKKGEDVTKVLAESYLAHASVSLYGAHNWSVNYYGAKLSNNLGMDGELFAYWNAARVKPSALSYLLLLLVLDRMNRHCRMPFEETKYLEHKLHSLIPSLFEGQGSALLAYLESRETSLYNEDVGAVERNRPGAVDTLIPLLMESEFTYQKGVLRSLFDRARGFLRSKA